MADDDSTDTAHAQRVPLTPALVSNELLCFVANKIDTIPTDTIVLLCAGQYDNGVIETAKRTLYDLCPCGNSRYIQRKGHKKKTQNLEDIVKRLHEYDSTTDTPRPCFDASNLANLPPITFDSIDVSVLLLKLERLTDDVTILKSGLQSHGDATQGLTDVCRDTAARIAMLEHLSDRPHIERVQSTRNAVRNASALPPVTPATLSSPSLVVDLSPAVQKTSLSAPLAVALPPAVQTSSCASLVVTLPPAVQMSSCAPLTVALPPAVQTSSCAPLTVALPPAVQTSSCAPLAVAQPPAVQTSSCAPLVVALPPAVQTSSCAPLADALPPAVQMSSCAPLAVVLPPAVQTSSCAPLAVAQPPAVQTSSCAPLAVALPPTALTTSSCATIALPPESVTWSTVVRSRPKRSASLIAAGKPQPSNTKKPVREKEETSEYIRFAFRARPVPSCIETLLGRGFPNECYLHEA